MTNRSTEDHPHLVLYRCPADHSFFYPHETCPDCRLELAECSEPPGADLISQTIVRVGPTGGPFRLGIARVRCGAKTLCLVDDAVALEGDVRVILEERDGVYRAKPAAVSEGDKRPRQRPPR